MTEQPDAAGQALAAPETPAPESPGPEAPAPEVAPKRSRRVLWAVARWTAAVVVCGGLGAGTAVKITSMERTDVPGLATEDDGRWVYPKLSLPALPEGVQRPFTEGNLGEIHHADLRALLLPAPQGATVDAKLNGGWATVDQYLALYAKEARPDLRESLDRSALRHITARAWTMPDGTRTHVFLLRFNSVAFSETFRLDAIQPASTTEGMVDVTASTVDDDWSSSGRVAETSVYAFVEKKPYGAEQSRWSYIQAGDTFALVRQDRKGGAAAVPFHQTVILQNQLLG